MIDHKTMHNLQSLSRLRLEPEEVVELSAQLEEILEYFSVLATYDTACANVDLDRVVEPGSLRPDQAGRSLSHAEIKSIAVEFEGGHFVVPRIIGDSDDA